MRRSWLSLPSAVLFCVSALMHVQDMLSERMSSGSRTTTHPAFFLLPICIQLATVLQRQMAGKP